MIDALNILYDQFDTYKHYNVDTALYSFGLLVHPEYRQRGIATEMLKARRPLMETLNVKLTISSFTAVGSQNAAKKAGYDENFAIP